MRAVLQRVAHASVTVNGECVGSIKEGILALVGINTGDNDDTFKYILDKITNLRIFEDENDKMNLSLRDKNYGLLIVPNFTIYADARKGRRPSFAMGAKPDEAEGLFERFVEVARESFGNVQTGIFRADMKVELLNDGPITILLDSEKLF
jgi:D-tyrosyl-tRNA(Tyr) deacylase